MIVDDTCSVFNQNSLWVRLGLRVIYFVFREVIVTEILFLLLFFMVLELRTSSKFEFVFFSMGPTVFYVHFLRAVSQR